MIMVITYAIAESLNCCGRYNSGFAEHPVEAGMPLLFNYRNTPAVILCSAPHTWKDKSQPQKQGEE
jgi:hypothetical protein